jgi:N-methylhydantoinase B/oxoprolinase/acetone carboxylase alpha subunit
MKHYDPVKLQLYYYRFKSIAEEMGEALMRSSFSPNIRERRDFSTAVFDAQGKMVCQADHMPVHLGSMPLSVAAAIELGSLEPGDAVLLNDPYHGGTHLPDMTLVSPVFFRRKLVFFIATRAHHADVGGQSPGSMPVASEIFAEGLRVPPVKLLRRGVYNESVLCLLLSNVRTPVERKGDLLAQVAANRLGERRAKELLTRFGEREVRRYGGNLQDYSETMVRQAISLINNGTYSFTDYMDDDGMGAERVRIKVTVAIRGSRARVDFSGTDDQVRGSINAVYAVTASAVYFVFRSMVREEIPFNDGCLRPMTITAPEGCLLNARPPAAVSAGNVETSQRVVDVLYGALAKAAPKRIPAASCGSMTNVSIGGTRGDGTPYTYYETVAGGMGARPLADGLPSIHTHMTNTRNTPVEVVENEFPLRVHRYAIRYGSGGAGSKKGGAGAIREIEFLSDCEVSVVSDRRKTFPYGLLGGSHGKAGKNELVKHGVKKAMNSKATCKVSRGDRLILKTPGGGGYGKKK